MKTIYSFVRGDEVYKVGDVVNPLGKVVGLGSKNVIIIRYSDGRRISVNPNEIIHPDHRGFRQI